MRTVLCICVCVPCVCVNDLCNHILFIDVQQDCEVRGASALPLFVRCTTTVLPSLFPYATHYG